MVANFSKLALTSILYIASLRFGCQLKRIMKEATREYGLKDPHVKQLAMTYWFVKWLIITFIVGDLIVNLIKPIIFIEIANGTIA